LEDRTVPSFLAPITSSGPRSGPILDIANNPVAGTVGDFNHDGRADLVTADVSHNVVGVRLANGDGTFGAARSFATGAGPTALAVGDFNHDGQLDVVTGNTSGSVSVLLGLGDGTFRPARTSPLPGGPNPGSFVTGDLNGDGNLDLVATTSAVTSARDARDYTRVLLGKGDGSFAAQGANLVGTAWPFNVALGDFNGDGRSDLVTVVGGTATLQLAQSNGTLQGPTVVATAVIGPVVVADFNGDGVPDFMVNSAVRLRVYVPVAQVVALGNGDGTFRVSTLPDGVWHSWAAAVADFNHDGKVDVLRDASDGTISVLLGNGDGTFQTAQDLVVGTGFSTAVAVGDFDGDGWLDVATFQTVSPDTTIVSVLLNNRHW
jgi:hypothetical protein